MLGFLCVMSAMQKHGAATYVEWFLRDFPRGYVGWGVHGGVWQGWVHEAAMFIF